MSPDTIIFRLGTEIALGAIKRRDQLAPAFWPYLDQLIVQADVFEVDGWLYLER
jgi:hypothetical protein